MGVLRPCRGEWLTAGQAQGQLKGDIWIGYWGAGSDQLEGLLPRVAAVSHEIPDDGRRGTRDAAEAVDKYPPAVLETAVDQGSCLIETPHNLLVTVLTEVIDYRAPLIVELL